MLSSGRRMSCSLHGHGHTEPIFRIFLSRHNHRLLGNGCSRCRFRGYSSSFKIWATLNRWLLYSMPCAILLSLCNTFWSTSFSCQASTLDHNELQLRPRGRNCRDLSSSGSASASRAPRTTCCRSRWATVRTCHDDGAILLVLSILVGHMVLDVPSRHSGQDGNSTRLAWNVDVRWLHCSAAEDVDDRAIRSGTLCKFRGRFHTCVADQTHAVPRTRNVGCVIGHTNDLIPETAEDLGESSPFCLSVRISSNWKSCTNNVGVCCWW